MYNRKTTKKVYLGSVAVGGGSQVLVQSMTNTKTSDIEATVNQIKRLEEAKCEIVRCSVPDMESAKAVSEIKKRINIPLVADIHFDYRLAIAAIEAGVDKLRINPGNIGGKDKIEKLVGLAKERKVPIRIGVNSGSVEKSLLEKYGGASPEALVESALSHVSILERLNFSDIIISVKSSSVMTSIAAHEILSQKTDYPIHVGITESGTFYSGTVKSAAGIGAILSRGIGDTIRVSLTDDPVKEVECGWEILKALGIRKSGVEIISCPTCARTKMDIIKMAGEVERRCKNINKDIKVAVMGCAVNGPGEAREADFGIAGGDGEGILFIKGEIYKKLPEAQLVDALMDLILIGKG